MQSVELMLKNTFHSYIDELCKKMEQYHYALIWDNGEHYLELFGIDSNIDNERISQFITETYGYEVYIFRTQRDYEFLLIFNTSNCEEFKLNLLNITSLYKNAVINFIPSGYCSTSLFDKLSASKILSVQKIEIALAGDWMGRWAKSLIMNSIEKKLENHKLHHFWFDFSDLESLSISRYKYNDEFVWAMIYYDHYDYDLAGGVKLIFFHQGLEFVTQKVKEYIQLLEYHKIQGAMLGFGLLETEWSGNELYKKFWFSDLISMLNCQIFYQEEIGSYYSSARLSNLAREYHLQNKGV